MAANSNTRTNTPTQVPSMPKVPADASPEMRRYLETLSQAVTIRLGRRGDPRDRAVTLRELIDSGLATELAMTPFDPNRSGNAGFGPSGQFLTDLAAPPAPTGFTANGAYSQINLNWDYPAYSNHSHTEVYVHTSDVSGDATLLGIQTGRVFVDPVGSGQTRYYWVRHVNTDGIAGPFNSASGTAATTATDVNHMLGVLATAITSSELASSLSTPIGNLPTDTQTAINDLQSQINDIGTVSLWGSSTSYSEGDLVLHPSSNSKLYRSKTNSNSNNQPSGTTADTNYWEFVGTGGSIGDVVAANTASITQINFLDATSTSAAAQKIASLDSTVFDAATGVSATSTALSGLTTRVTTAENTISGHTININANSSDITALENTVNNPSTGVAATSSALTSLTSTVTSQGNSISANSTSLSSLTTTVGNNTSSISSQASSINGLEAKYVVKIDNNGAVAGFGLASTANSAGNITSEFIVNADRFAIMRGGSNTAAATVPFVVQASQTTLNDETVPAGVYIADAFIKNGSIESAKIGSLDAGKITAGTILAERIGANSIEGSKLKIDSNYLSVDNNGELQLVTSDGTNGIKVENLSNDAVGVIALGVQSGSKIMSNRYYAPALYTASEPYSEYTEWDYEFDHPGNTYTLDTLMTLSVPAEQLSETGEYYIDFGANPFGGLTVNTSSSASQAMLTIGRRYYTSTGSYTHVESLATQPAYNSILPLNMRLATKSTNLDADYDYQFKLHGYIRAFTGTKGMNGGYIRIMRINKST